MHELLISTHASLAFWHNILAQRTTLLLLVLISLIGSIAESARYRSTRDNHVVGVMSRCESNKSRFTLFTNSEGRSHMINTWQYADAHTLRAGLVYSGNAKAMHANNSGFGFVEVYMQAKTIKSQRQCRRKINGNRPSEKFKYAQDSLQFVKRTYSDFQVNMHI